MKFLSYGKDGGPDSTVWGYWLVEIKRLFSIALLCFENGSRDAYHSHAFNAVSWVLKGQLREQEIDPETHGIGLRGYTPSLRPIITKRSTMHKVTSVGRTWVLSFRGPWNDVWHELKDGRDITLTHGRQEL
jgi:hypothetical protein